MDFETKSDMGFMPPTEFFPYMTERDVSNLGLTDSEIGLVVYKLQRLKTWCAQVSEHWWDMFDAGRVNHWMDTLITMGYARSYSQVITKTFTLGDPIAEAKRLYDNWLLNNFADILIHDVIRQDRAYFWYETEFARNFQTDFFHSFKLVIEESPTVRMLVTNKRHRKVRNLAAYVCNYYQNSRQICYVRTQITGNFQDVSMVGHMVAIAAERSRRPGSDQMAAILASIFRCDRNLVHEIISSFRDYS
jgi:hypothetical protein